MIASRQAGLRRRPLRPRRQLALGLTSRRVEELIDDASKSRRKLILFVTGVPGAGKTLVGLNVATRRR
jgi:Mrp family chromosome partitioning ATPase